MKRLLEPESDAFVAFATELFRAISDVAALHHVSLDKAIEIVSRAQLRAPGHH